MLTTVADSYVSVSLTAVALPGTTSYSTTAITLAALAVDLLLIVMISTWLRHKIPAQWWPGLHLAVYASWGLATIHALMVGTGETWTLAISFTGAVAVVLVLAVRGFFTR
jgi:sulfoxide reductase heme-binding subunit YedZ